MSLSVGILIGGAVASSLGKAVSDAKGKITGLGAAAQQARGWQAMISDTQRLQREFGALGDKSSKAADDLRKKIESNQAALRKQGIEVDKLGEHYNKLGAAVKSYELKLTGVAKLEKGRAQMGSAVADTAKMGAAVAGPTMVSAGYQAIIRDIAIKAGVARTPEEKNMGDKIAKTASDNGIGRNELAAAVNAMVAGGMDLKKAVDFAPAVAKFAVGQGSTPEETAKMIGALQQNAGIESQADMMRVMETIAYQGKAGSFESADMAKWFPALLAEMKKVGIVGPESVASLGAMLQVQMKTVGSSDEAANNLKNWFSKIGAEDTKKNYAKAGIDYEGSMRATIAGGKNTLEASFDLAKKYIEKTDPKKAQQMSDAVAKISKESDPEKAKKMMAAFEETMKTGDLFGDMQVKAALTAYGQNKDLYQKLKKEGMAANGEIEKDLADRRATSAAIWQEAGQAFDEAMRKIGDAIAPITDAVGSFAGKVAKKTAAFAGEYPQAATGLAVVAGGLIAVKTAVAGWSLARGAVDLARAGVLARKGGKFGSPAEAAAAAAAGGTKPGTAVQQVFVTNWPAGGVPAGSGAAAPAGGNPPAGGEQAAGKGKPGTAKPASRLGKLGATVGKAAGMVGKVGGAAAVLGGGYMLYDALSSDKPKEEKAKDVGGAAGNIGGGLAGAAAGAALGSVVPVIGTAIGGLIGGALGAWGGGALGQTLGDAVGKKITAPAAPAAPATASTTPAAQEPGKPAEATAGAPALFDWKKLAGFGSTALGAAALMPGRLGDAARAAAPVTGYLVDGMASGGTAPSAMPGAAAQPDASAQPAGMAWQAAAAAALPLLGAAATAAASRRGPGGDGATGPAMGFAGSAAGAGQRGAGNAPPAGGASEFAGARGGPGGLMSALDRVNATADTLGKLSELASAVQGPAQPAAPAPAVTFAPVISVTVQGDVKDPAKLASELVPHLKQLMGSFMAQQGPATSASTKTGRLYDAAHV